MSDAIIWAAAGVGLIIADVIFGTFFVMFLGLGALITGLTSYVHLTDHATGQWLTFALASALGVLLFRKKMLSMFGPSAEGKEKYTDFIGHPVTVVTAIPAGGTGRVSYRGSEWPAESEDGSAMAEGESAVVRRTDGITLVIGRR